MGIWSEFAVVFIFAVVFLSTVSRSNWDLNVLFLVEGGKLEKSEKNPQSKVEIEQQTQPTWRNLKSLA